MGEKLTVDEPPVPVRLAVRGLPVALSVMVTVALRVPAAVGLKVTLIVQLPPTPRLEPQPLVWAKSPLLVPVTATLLMASAEPVPLVSVSA